ncbi:inner-membrane translocator:ABC transporter related protein [Alcanivorax sp. S71-1-4]|uniref:branched-chain amino acid ABC transporter ATP-binding protein/permease n=1 Tax=Alcanivorax sp. S71-1-4 TaxID=1177159 RepID=UPI001359DF91|nr:branched-chain amino acid ABC transporter ATP-binding protein/permease [Alcanivorax sp. S71-1-4]KAF0805642.1 inner-membrane translocator:ABC transporter related protein [Alcanivorax sp. S71-1-4]
MQRKLMLPLGLSLALALLGPLLLPDYQVTLVNYIGLYSIVALGLVLLTGIGGLTSFGQAAFVGIGAYSTAVLTTALGLSPWLGLLVGLGLTGLIALVLGMLTLRLSGHYLPLGTLAWGLSIFYLFGNLPHLGGYGGINNIPTVSLLGWELSDARDFNVLIWLVIAAVIWLISNLLDSREGRAIRALKYGTVMTEAMGVHSGRSKLVIFVVAALLAALSGWLYAHMQRFVNPTPFSINMGIEYLFMIVLGGAASLLGAIFGATLLTVLKQWLQDLLPQLFGQGGNFEMIFFGILIVLCMQYARAGLWPLISARLPKRAGGTPAPPDLDTPPLPRREALPEHAVLLRADGVVKRFGGLVANNNMNLQVNSGEITALIGPNGAGKSTLFNLLSGVLPPSAGEIHFRDQRIDQLSSRRINALGVSRTFQHVRLVPDMTVLENVSLGAHRRGHAGLLRTCLHLERGEEGALLAEAARQIERVGLGEHLLDEAGNLPLGKQRIVEIARALCADPYLLLLDEPAAGLRHLEKQALGALLRRLREEGMGVLLVEHDMDFVMDLADHVVVMEFGEKLASGLPHAIQENPAVMAAYLGGAE